MDALHHDCATALSRFAGTAESEFPDYYQALIAKVERIFRTEERWMEEIDFPELQPHRAQHASILGTLYQAQGRVMAGDVRCGQTVIETLLPECLILHASTMDCALAHRLKLEAMPVSG